MELTATQLWERFRDTARKEILDLATRSPNFCTSDVNKRLALSDDTSRGDPCEIAKARAAHAFLSELVSEGLIARVNEEVNTTYRAATEEVRCVIPTSFVASLTAHGAQERKTHDELVVVDVLRGLAGAVTKEQTQLPLPQLPANTWRSDADAPQRKMVITYMYAPRPDVVAIALCSNSTHSV